MNPLRVTKLVACAAAVLLAPSEAFTGGLNLAASSRHQVGRRRMTNMMAIDPITVHAVGDYVNAVGSTGLDPTWLSHVLHGE